MIFQNNISDFFNDVTRGYIFDWFCSIYSELLMEKEFMFNNIGDEEVGF